MEDLLFDNLKKSYNSISTTRELLVWYTNVVGFLTSFVQEKLEEIENR